LQIIRPQGDFEFTNVPLALPGPGQVWVKVAACGVCHSDSIVKKGMVPLPWVPGHEIVGDVVAVHESELAVNVRSLMRKDATGQGAKPVHFIFVPALHSGRSEIASAPAGTAATALTALTAAEEISIPVKTKDHVHGVYAEYAGLRSEALLPVPDDMDLAEVAPHVGASLFNSVRNQGAFPGDIVAVKSRGLAGHGWRQARPT
jgi:D-arabinose 1-dehydrogenase-like Zn-dependent alcohol dehydrogenase